MRTMTSQIAVLFTFLVLITSTQVFADNVTRDQEIKQRFAKCDKNHDGKLTKEEAKGCMPRIYDHFDYVDSAGNGYVTVAQIEAIANN
jgi:Ca2+-binding EF-hand superfamily protein